MDYFDQDQLPNRHGYICTCSPSSYPCNKCNNAAYYKRHKDKTAVRNRRRKFRIRYGITPEQYDAMFEAQGGVCYICKRPPKKERRLAVDHNHQTGKVRKLLCTRCNAFVGHAENKLYIDYLKEHKNG